MATTAHKTNRHPNGVQPKYIDLGTDTEGGVHTYRTTDSTVFVVRDGDLVHREDLAAKCADLDDWMEHAARLTGWQQRRYGQTLGEMLSESMADTGAD